MLMVVVVLLLLLMRLPDDAERSRDDLNLEDHCIEGTFVDTGEWIHGIRSMKIPTAVEEVS